VSSSLDKQKIIIVSCSFYPMNSPRSFRTTELVKEFARQGHEVVLLTPWNEELHPGFELKHGIRIKDLGSANLKRFDSSENGRVVSLFKRILNRALNLLIEFPDIQWMWKVKKALKYESGYDLLISIAAPHSVHWGVAWTRSERHPIAKTWVADCGDPFMGTVLDTFRKLFYFKHLEKMFCRKADFITVPIKEAIDAYYPEFRSKIRVIPQGFNFDEVTIDRSAYRKNGKPIFAYAGTLIPGGRDPGEFLEYLSDLGKDFKFILYTKSRSLVDPWKERMNGKLEVRDYIPREELLKELSKMDFLVNFENSTPLQMPSKLIDYYLTGRPVLSVPSKKINREKVSEFMAGSYDRKIDFSGMERFRIENVCHRFLELSMGGER